MVRQLKPPRRPLPTPGERLLWWWEPPEPEATWPWCRVYHRNPFTADGATFRRYGPLARFDQHRPADPPADDGSGRRVLYVGEDLATSACEVFGEAGVATICPNYRVAIIAPTRQLPLFDLLASGAAMAIGALPALGSGSEARALTQQWARAIYEDRPSGPATTGIHYSSAYNSGQALALWDCEDQLEVVRDNAGRLQDFPLNDLNILTRLDNDLRFRQISVTTTTVDICSECRKWAS